MPLSRLLNIAVFSFDQPHSACAWYRLLSPMRALKDRISCSWAVRMDARANIQAVDMGCLERADLVLIQRFFPLEMTAPLLEQIFATGKPVLYETDDFFFEIPDENPTATLARRCAPYAKEVMRAAALVTTPTQALAERLAQYAREVAVLPNLLDERIWSAPPRQASSRTRPTVIGFAGSETHVQDLERIEGVLLDLAARYKERLAIRLMGCATARLKACASTSVVPHQNSFDAYARAMQRSSPDIGLAPLVPNAFNACKSEIKWLEYTVCGAAGVLQDLAPYNAIVAHARTGMLAGDERQWREALELLIEQPKERAKMASAAREEVLRGHTVEKGKELFWRCFERVARE
jgi:hypothetical protein